MRLFIVALITQAVVVAAAAEAIARPMIGAIP